jgi:hypothetical protein
MSKNDDLLISANKVFIEEEVKKLYDVKLQNFLREAIKDFPDYFWTAPASLEKYHYPDERLKGGLVLHVRRLCKLVDVMALSLELNMWERDVLISSCILHDSFARGIPPYTKGYSDPFHPIYPAERFPYNGYADRFIDKKIYDEIMDCVVSHLGRYSVHPIMYSKKKLATVFQWMDYVASRDFIKIEV